jgi:hypothetical protein
MLQWPHKFHKHIFLKPPNVSNHFFIRDTTHHLRDVFWLSEHPDWAKYHYSTRHQTRITEPFKDQAGIQALDAAKREHHNITKLPQSHVQQRHVLNRAHHSSNWLLWVWGHHTRKQEEEETRSHGLIYIFPNSSKSLPEPIFITLIN